MGKNVSKHDQPEISKTVYKTNKALRLNAAKDANRKSYEEVCSAIQGIKADVQKLVTHVHDCIKAKRAIINDNSWDTCKEGNKTAKNITATKTQESRKAPKVKKTVKALVQKRRRSEGTHLRFVQRAKNPELWKDSPINKQSSY